MKLINTARYAVRFNINDPQYATMTQPHMPVREIPRGETEMTSTEYGYLKGALMDQYIEDGVIIVQKDPSPIVNSDPKKPLKDNKESGSMIGKVEVNAGKQKS